MEALALSLAALLVVLAVVFVARPFLREGGEEEADAVVAEDRLRLLEERDRALAALKELEFDHRTGKVSDEDYRAAVARLRREAAEALAALENGSSPKGERARADVHG